MTVVLKPDTKPPMRTSIFFLLFLIFESAQKEQRFGGIGIDILNHLQFGPFVYDAPSPTHIFFGEVGYKKSHHHHNNVKSLKIQPGFVRVVRPKVSTTLTVDFCLQTSVATSQSSSECYCTSDCTSQAVCTIAIKKYIRNSSKRIKIVNNSFMMDFTIHVFLLNMPCVLQPQNLCSLHDHGSVLKASTLKVRLNTDLVKCSISPPFSLDFALWSPNF